MDTLTTTAPPAEELDSIGAIEAEGRQLAGKFSDLLERLREAQRTAAAPSRVNGPGSHALTSAQSQLEQAIQERNDARAKCDTALGELQQLETRLDVARAELAQLDKEIEAAHVSIASLQDHRTRVEADVAAASEWEGKLKSLQSQCRDAEAKMDELRAMEQKLAHMAKLGENANLLLSKLWPAWLLSGELSVWKEKIERKLTDESAPPSFGLLFAAIHGYNAALRDPDPKALFDNVRDVGRRLYQWLEDSGNNPSETAVVAEAWASAINAEAAGRCSVQVAVPGNPASNQWMIFTPRGGSSPDVATAKSWCVLDGQRRPIHRAEVTV